MQPAGYSHVVSVPAGRLVWTAGQVPMDAVAAGTCLVGDPQRPAASRLGFLTVGQTARILGVSLSVLSAIAYMAYTPAFPALCLVVIAMDILIIYAITVHGRDLKEVDH